jgi:hypothetical protein
MPQYFSVVLGNHERVPDHVTVEVVVVEQTK